MRDVLGVILATLLLFVALEGLLRGTYALRNAMLPAVVLPYTAAQDWGPVPPWLDRLRILESDPVLLWRNRPGVRRRYLDVYGPARREADRLALLQQFWPRVPAALRDNPTWSVGLGSHGFRTEEFVTQKVGGLRIACLGDSWTFGANVDQEATYPRQLGERLAKTFPASDIEVLNLGVMGYSSRQGLELLRRTVLGLKPDVVLIGFAMNDSVVAGWHDRDSVGATGTKPSRRWLDDLETLRLSRYLLERARYEPWTIGDYLTRVAAAAGSEDELWTGRQAVEFASEESLARLARVPPREYETHLREMVRLAREHGADAMLLYNELWDTPYRDAVERVAEAEGIPWVDTYSLIVAERERRERDLATRLGLGAAGTGPDELVLRVHQGSHAVADSLYVAGTHPALGDEAPNRVALHDDGTHGDERAGDGVWSLGIAVEPGVRIFYVYTNSGREGQWEGLDVPDLRHLEASPGYRPIEHFGALALQADGWHTDATGYELLASAAAEKLAPRLLQRSQGKRATEGAESATTTSRPHSR